MSRPYVQRDFSGGAISPKMLLRQDTEVYQRSVLAMQNYIPTPQGTARRAPGTRFIQDLGEPDIRIIPYLSPANERSLVKLTPETCEVLFNVNDRVNADYTSVVEGGGVLTFRKRINPNTSFQQGLTDWVADPDEYEGADGFAGLGVYADPDTNNAIMRPRIYNDPGDGISPVTLSQQCVVDTPTSVATILYRARYGSNWAWSGEFGGYTLTFQVSEDSTFATTLYENVFDSANFPDIGSVFFEEANFDLPTADWTGTLYIRITAAARGTNETQYSNPRFIINFLDIYADGEVDVESLDAPLVTPYLAADLPDVQFVQSPYSDKELVFVHPKYPPHRLYFKTTGAAGYVFEEIDFDNTPESWGTNNYPAACSSFSGRLVLAGGARVKTAPGDPIAIASETVWCTEVGDWTKFSAADEVNADDSIEFTAIYRSPIQWVYGQRSLLIGSLEYEYTATASSVSSPLAPGDIGVFLQSTHGSRNVQPAGFGNQVLFASDGGTKVRSLSYSDEGNGWVADDLTLYNPEICESGIVRMVRQRNPHQMCLVLLESGAIAIYHSEGNTAGWTTYVLNNGQIKDLCIVADEDGADVPYLVVRRVVDGSEVTYLECIPNWVESRDWDYSECTKFYQFEAATDTITGLDHLEGKRVQVYDESRFVGLFTVTSGSVTLSDDTDTGTTPMINARVGQQHKCRLVTLPPNKVDPGAKSRFADYAVRIVNSTRPIINGERPANRRPGMQLGLSQVFEEFEDVHVSTRGWSPTQTIEISEQAPFRNEVIGVFGTLKEGTVP